MCDHSRPVDIFNFLAYSFFCRPDSFPDKLKRSDVYRWLTNDINASDDDARKLISRLEERLGWPFDDGEASAAGDHPICPPEPGFGQTQQFTHPHYRPLALVFVIYLVHGAMGIAMRLMGFKLCKPLRRDLRGVVRFFVLHPEKDGSRNYHSRPLLVFHGFGFGLLPYFPAVRPNQSINAACFSLATRLLLSENGTKLQTSDYCS